VSQKEEQEKIDLPYGQAHLSVGSARDALTSDPPARKPQRPEKKSQRCMSHFRRFGLANARAGPISSSNLSRSINLSMHAWGFHHNHHQAKGKSIQEKIQYTTNEPNKL
jgi:hypothetical protein